MRQRFDKMSDDIISKIDDMGVRIDELEQQISSMVEHSPAEPSKSK
jgi:hypothetical protein